MRITRLTLSNFRSFGPQPTAIDLDAITAVVGSNASGKTAVLSALARLFGVSAGDRGIVKSDFHIPHQIDPATVAELSLFIEARIDFPELGNHEEIGEAVPEYFRQMSVDAPNEPPYCRVRLVAKWSRTNLPEGEVEEQLAWVSSADEVVLPEYCTRLTGDQRSRIQVLYVPAARDTVKQLRRTSGTLFHRLLSVIRWSDQIRRKVEDATSASNRAFRSEPGVNIIEKTINQMWTVLHDFQVLKTVHLRTLQPQFEDLLRQVEMVFSPSEGATEQPAERLSDGLRSLFYLTLIAGVFHVEQAALDDIDMGEASPLRGDEIEAPILTMLAIEEPENHLAPHYLGRILKLLTKISESNRAQVLLTSHSTAILKRLDPTTVRHLSLDLKTHQTISRRITLPPEADEAHKYVRQAVRAYPELYFARVVVLCEGESEEIILPRLFEEADLPVDPSFVSVVPLGGRHVNHFWRLLNALSIPHVTLLDLDRERETGGWGRVKYVLDQLLTLGRSKTELLVYTVKGRGPAVLSDKELKSMATWDDGNKPVMGLWLRLLQSQDVFFSVPLDIDFAMLRSFPDAYRSAKTGVGPRNSNQTKNFAKYEERIKNACRAVLKCESATADSYTEEEKDAFIWYHHLFLGRGKPSTHILALNEIRAGELWEKAPAQLKLLVKRVREILSSHVESAVDETLSPA